ncbi:MAG: PASTA domain-containing protein, partial [Sciscionella sp.]
REQASRARGANQPTVPHARGREIRKRSRRVLWIWIVVVLVLAAAVGTAAWWFGSGRWTAVPMLTGVQQSTAEHRLDTADLTARVRPTQNDSVPAGQVITTSPVGGAHALRGSSVLLTVSTGLPRVPAVATGASLAAATSAITAAGLHASHSADRDAYDAKVAKGTVLRLDPAPGTRLHSDTPVQVVLSRGPAPVKVPDLAGRRRAAAFAALRSAGLRPYDAKPRYSADRAAGTVIGTDPPAGSTIATGASHRVGVVVSTAVTVPSVTGKPVGEARKALKKLGLTVRVQQFLHRNSSTVVEQSAAPGSRVAPGSTVILAAFP